MPPVSDPDIWSVTTEYRRSAGDEPISGYVLIEPLGRGGFGEVWKCEAPGGLHKAIKFVAGAAGPDEDSHQLDQEFAAFQKIKAIRHPFLLTLERVELIGNELMMVMELADRQLADRFNECREQGLPGIPRRELLDYFEEAAEALDVISAQYGLQHLDVKPANLFLTAGHVKVGDYGLVKKLDGANMVRGSCGLTPKYVAPEVLRGEVHTRSDQYSLALVYQELLTGKFPYAAKSTQQMMLAHISSQPDVSPLPKSDQSAVFTALQKRPEDRFASCMDFVAALMEAGWAAEQSPRASMGPFQIRSSGSIAYPKPRVELTPAPAGEETGRHPNPNEPTATSPADAQRAKPSDRTNAAAQKTIPLPPGKEILPGLITAGSRPASVVTPPPAAPAPAPAPAPAEEELPLAAETEAPPRIRIRKIRSIVTAQHLTGADLRRPERTPSDFIEAVLKAAAPGGFIPQFPGEVGREKNGTWTCRFPSTVAQQIVPLKLAILRENWNVTIDQPEPNKVILRKSIGGGFWSKKFGFEVEVNLGRGGRTLGEVVVTGAFFGSPDRQFVQNGEDIIPKILGEVRTELGNVADRRKTPRLPAALPITVHPLHSDGRIDPPITAKTRDVSLGGIGIESSEPIRTKYIYVSFPSIAADRDLFILARLMRSQTQIGDPAHFYGGQYRTDL